jgi:uncharacterized protein (TIGR03437 family)
VIHRFNSFALAFLLLPAICLAQSYTISTVVGTCSASGTTPPCLGEYTGDGGAATSAEMNGPYDVIFDSSGNLYISDSNNNRIREVSTTGTINTVVGNGTAGWAGDGSSPTASGTELNTPAGMAFDSSANLYIADSDNYVVRKVAGGVINTIAGDNHLGAVFSGDYGAATSAGMWNPSGVAVDPSGNIYIADPYNNVVRVVCQNQTPIACGTGPQGFPPGGTYTFAVGDINTFAGQDNCNGTPSTTCAGYIGDGGVSTGALLNNPSAVLLDPAGNLYISDTGNNAIRKVTPAGIITTVVGDGTGTPGYKGDGGKATAAWLNNPKGLAMDADGNLYIADSINSVIRMVTPSGFITTIAGNQSAGPGYTGDGAAATSAQLYFPSGVAVNTNGKIYIADYGNNLVRMLTPVAQVPQIDKSGVLNAASYGSTQVPGSIAAVYGNFFLIGPLGDTTLPLLTSMQNLSFQFGGTAAPLFFDSDLQANIQVPWELAGQSSASLAVTLNGTAGNSQTVTLADFAPAIFTTNAGGTGQGAILNSSYQLVDASNPATAGTTNILIYCTGLGAVAENQPATGAPASSDPTKLAHTSTLPTVTIGDIGATVSFSGLAPGFVGLYQVNALVPAGVAAGSAVPVTIAMGSVTSNTATIAVQ